MIQCFIKKRITFIFFDNFDKSGAIFNFFSTVKFRKDLWVSKLELKLTLPLNLLPHYLAKCRLNVQLNSFTVVLARTISFMSGDISFMSFYLLIWFFLPDTDVFVTLLRYFVCCVNHAFYYMKINVLLRTIDAYTDSGVHHSKHAYVTKAPI